MRDAIIGKIYFLLVRIKVKYMELAIIKREIIGDNAQNETETVAKYEIMDGAPVKGESIPIRLFLSAYNLTPTMRDIQKKFSCKYYLNLVLVDEEERRYFKQQEIILWRKADKYKSKQERSDQMQVINYTKISLSFFSSKSIDFEVDTLDDLDCWAIQKQVATLKWAFRTIVRKIQIVSPYIHLTHCLRSWLSIANLSKTAIEVTPSS